MTKARSNAVAEAAKGDLSVGTGTNLAGILAVGSNGDTLVADSSTSTGLRYNPLNALVNPFINGGMDCWQRGTSFSLSSGANPSYVADRWMANPGTQTLTISRQATGDTTNLPNIQYALRWQRNSGVTSTGDTGLVQSLETVNAIPYAGKTVTYSFYARAGANFSGSIIAYLFTGTGTDQNRLLNAYTGGVTAINQTFTPTTTWQRFTYTVALQSSVTEFASYFLWTPSGTAGAADYVEITGVQIDLGTYTSSSAPAFRRSGGTIQGELAACMRYYQLSGAGTVGVNENTTFQSFGAVLPVTMRTVPTLSLASTTQTFFNYGVGTATQTISSIWGSDAKNNGYYIEYNTASSGVTTVNKVIILFTNNLALSAEL
jgi:hypothetical protein